MKIAVSGSVGIGKTTLVNQLAEQLELAVVEEFYEEYFGGKSKFNSTFEEAAGVFRQVLEFKHNKEEEYQSFITDRCPVDLMNLWLKRGLQRGNTDSRSFYEKCRAFSLDYDFIIFLPWDVIPLKQLDDVGKSRRRILNSWTQLDNQACMLGLAYSWLGDNRIIQLPASELDTQQRVDFVLEKINTNN